MIHDVSFLIPEPTQESEIPNGHIQIIDLSGFKLSHFTKVIYSVMKMNMRYTQVCLNYLINVALKLKI